MRPTVLLFDIDGTLVTTGGAGRRALTLAFGSLYGREDACQFPLSGMTDRAIVRGGLTAIGVRVTDSEIDRVLAAYVAQLDRTIAEVAPDKYKVHEGMVEAVDRALCAQHFAVGLGTGNIKAGARAKLSRVELYDRFGFGGFGCDAEARPELIGIGAERGAAQLKVPLSECRVVVIGDTPKDVAAAKVIGAECVGVATGSFDVKSLLAAGATYAFRSLAEPEAMRALLNGK